MNSIYSSFKDPLNINFIDYAISWDEALQSGTDTEMPDLASNFKPRLRLRMP